VSHSFDVARSRYTCTIEGVLIVGVEAAALLEIADTNSFLDDAFINDRSSFRFCVFSDSVVIGYVGRLEHIVILITL